MVFIIDPEFKIAVGANQVGSLVRWNTITDANGVALVDPEDTWTGLQEAQRRFREDKTIAFEGDENKTWRIPFMTTAQWNTLHTTYQGVRVTIRDTDDGITFANYNATFSIPSRFDLGDVGTVFQSGDTPGLGWPDVPITLSGWEAI